MRESKVLSEVVLIRVSCNDYAPRVFRSGSDFAFAAGAKTTGRPAPHCNRIRCDTFVSRCSIRSILIHN